MSMDWDKLKVFHAAAEAGSFTHAGEALGLSQSAVSRQVSSLEQELGVSLFHRNARGLILTEQGEVLHPPHDVFMKLEAARAKLTDRAAAERRAAHHHHAGHRGAPSPAAREFVDLYPDVHLTLLTTDEELDLAMREADVAIRLRQPTQPDLIQRKLFSVRFHAYASPDYVKRFGTPRAHDDLDSTASCCSAAARCPITWRTGAGSSRSAGTGSARTGLTINTILGVARCQRGMGVALLPDYLVGRMAAGPALRRIRDDRARCLFCLSRGAQDGRPRPGVSRFSGIEGPALAFLMPHGDMRTWLSG
jgi:DNA-binding transcriptional LysR family regulator